MVKFCNYCGLEIHSPDTYTCGYCECPFCIEHRLVEDHDCQAARISRLEKKYSKEDIKSKTPVDWMYDCLSVAKDIINKHHKDESNFFSRSKFTLFIQTDREYAYGYIDGTDGDYKIGIHPSLSEFTSENKRMLVIVLVHELLHCIHADWGHEKINPEERNLANLAGYFDALRNMEVLYLSGKMRLCER